MKDMKALCDQVRQTAYDIHVNFGSYKFEVRKFVWSAHSKMQQRGAAFALISAFFAFFAVNQ